MICPHCSHDNPEGRKYCRGCAKPLGPGAPAENPWPAPAPPIEAKLSKMALASFVLSFFSLIFPIGITAVVLGHVSRNEIANDRGRLKGMGLAFAGLVIAYLQLIAASILVSVFVSLWGRFNEDLNRNPYARAALMEQIAARNPDPPSKDAAKRYAYVGQALRLIRARQAEYLAAHPDGYTCRLEQLGYSFSPINSEPTELGNLVGNSGYQVRIQQCMGNNELRYVVVAVPKSRYNDRDAPVFCLDSLEVIWKYSNTQAAGVLAQVTGRPQQLCPRDGERVE